MAKSEPLHCMSPKGEEKDGDGKKTGLSYHLYSTLSINHDVFNHHHCTT